MTREAHELSAHVDLSDPEFFQRAEEVDALFGHLRIDRPISWSQPSDPQMPGFWVLSRHADILAMTRQKDLFLSGSGNALTTLLNGGDSAGNKMLAVSDGKRHAGLRSRIGPAFRPDSLENLVEVIVRHSDALVRDAARRGDCDFALEVAQAIPLTAICEVLAVPRADRLSLLHRTAAALSSHEADTPDHIARRARMEILLYFMEHAKTDAVQDSKVLQALVGAGSDGEYLSDEDVVLNCYSLILGGDETTRLALCGAAAAFADHPDAYDSFRSGELSIDSAVEELLRWTTPLLHIGRTVREDTGALGVRMKKGDVVTGWLGSGNRDASVFSSPNHLDLARTPNKHLTFAYGTHFCLGAYMARVEMKAVLAALRRHVMHITRLGAGARLHSNFLTGYTSLPLHLTMNETTR